ncbi:hypothetical protein KA005_45390 [bacterium]|nr:hypothetical protein [bacterium]
MKTKQRAKRRTRRNQSKELPKHLQHINVNAAGIDVGSKSHFVAVPEKSDEECVR